MKARQELMALLRTLSPKGLQEREILLAGRRKVTRKSSEKPASHRLSKSDLPSKPCAGCGLPFSWRKKWERCWDEVKFCSDRCRRERRRGASGPS
jgi:hypothetical protein